MKTYFNITINKVDGKPQTFKKATNYGFNDGFFFIKDEQMITQPGDRGQGKAINTMTWVKLDEIRGILAEVVGEFETKKDRERFIEENRVL